MAKWRSFVPNQKPRHGPHCSFPCMLSGLCGWGVICTFDPWHFNFNCFDHSRSSLLHYSKAVCLCRHHEERRQRSHFICYLLSVTTTYLPQIPTPYGKKLRLRQTVCVCVCLNVSMRVSVCVCPCMCKSVIVCVFLHADLSPWSGNLIRMVVSWVRDR